MPRIAIVGGGPAGSATALFLLRHGVAPEDVVILDKARFPRPKLCGGALTWRGTELLRALIGHLPGGSTTDGLEFRSALGAFYVRERGPQWLYDRAHLDERLLRAASDAGVEVREETAVKGLDPSPTGWRVQTATGSETFAWVVGADGARGVVRRAAALSGGIVGRLVEGVYEPVSAELDPRRLYFDFDPIVDGIPGYAWLFPYPKPGEEHTARYWKLGIMDGRGVTAGKVLRDWTEALAERNGFRRVDTKLGGWPEHYYARRAEAHRPGLVLVGESWGIDPLLGEGIAPSLQMAQYAAERLKEALDRGTLEIRDYEKRFARTSEGRNLRFQAGLADLLYGPRPFRWLRVLFEHRHLQRLAERGDDAYGRLLKRAPELSVTYAWRVLTRGLPSTEPVRASA